MPAWQVFHIAENLEDALITLAQAPGLAMPIAGGTDLLLDLQQGRHAPVHTLVDLTRIDEFNELSVREGCLFIGAAVPVSRLAAHQLVLQHAHALAEACGSIGGPQVRNSATLGGNVAHGLPAADGMIALVALNAEVEVVSMAGRERWPLLSLFRGVGQTHLIPGQQLLSGFFLPLRHAVEGSAFRRVMRPQGVALPILNLSTWLRRTGDRIADVRMAFGPSGPKPCRAEAVEDCLRGEVFSDELIAAASETGRQTLKFRSSPQRASASYRYDLSAVLLAETLKTAWQRAGQEDE